MDDKVKELLDRIRDTASAAADSAADTARSALSRSAPWGSTEKDWAMESI